MNMFDGCVFFNPAMAAPDDHISDVTKMAPPLGPRGYRPLYHAGEVNHCPACGGTHWEVGRITAECSRAECETALPIAEGTSSQ